MKIKLVVTGRSYDQASDLPDTLELTDGATLDQAIAAVNELLGDHSLSASCLVALAGTHLGTVAQHEDRALQDGQELVLLQPVAGG